MFAEIQARFTLLYSQIVPDPPAKSTDFVDPSGSIATNFRLPITYLDPSLVHIITDVVSTDLELCPVGSVDKTMYDYLFQPKHVFAKDMLVEWRKQYTTDTEFLMDSQHILRNMIVYRESMIATPSMNCGSLVTIWQDIKKNEYFLDKYGYMDWELLKQFNSSVPFLQGLAFVHLVSPLASLVLPLLMLIFPFLILQVQGIPITFSMYIQVLKTIAANHFIGKALMNMGDVSWDKVAYLFLSAGMYCFQVYQNIHQCYRFHNHMKEINTNLLELRKTIEYSIASMNSFLGVAEFCKAYGPFCRDVIRHRNVLAELHEKLFTVSEFGISLDKFAESGNLLKLYYEVHDNMEYEASFRYAVGFEGYIDNLSGAYDNMAAGHLAFACIDASGGMCSFQDQYYPPLLHEFPIKNNCSFEKNMILSAPNKAGKTTILKSTVLNILFTQQLGCGFYRSAELTPYDYIHSYLNIPDTSGRDSLFQAESRRCKDIIDTIHTHPTARHFCVFDELYSGTNPTEAAKSGHAFLCYLEKFSNVNFILTTHYVSICKRFVGSARIQNFKMVVRVCADGSFDYTYRVRPGISRTKGAVRVLKDMQYPAEIIAMIENPEPRKTISA